MEKYGVCLRCNGDGYLEKISGDKITQVKCPVCTPEHTSKIIKKEIKEKEGK